jgi:hypothetical protein
LPGAPHLHVLFGWLQIDEVLTIGDQADAYLPSRPWLANHPHLANIYSGNNTVYVAGQRLTINGRDIGLPGAGVFHRFNPRLQLTKPGATRSSWTLPAWFLPETGPTLSYHTDPTRWSKALDQVELRSVAKGQEFVMDVSGISGAEEWISSLADCADESEADCAELREVSRLRSAILTN